MLYEKTTLWFSFFPIFTPNDERFSADKAKECVNQTVDCRSVDHVEVYIFSSVWFLFV